MSIFLIYAVDSALGRFDRSSMTDQARMEKVFGDLDEDYIRAYFLDENGDFLDTCEWRGVKCDSKENVVELEMPEMLTDGELDLDFLPPNVRIARINGHELHFSPKPERVVGTLDASLLPKKLETFFLMHQGCSGTIDFPSLPKALKLFSVANSAFEGSCVLVGMPESLEENASARTFLQGRVT